MLASHGILKVCWESYCLMDVLIYQVCSNCNQYLGSPPTLMMQRRPVSAIYSQARMIKVYINLFEEEYKCAQVRKHKAAQDKKYLSEEEVCASP
jgi:hypothetical protein